MEDVLFSGTSNRPEKNIAEVSIAVKMKIVMASSKVPTK